MTGTARQWLAAHLPWIVIALLCLWLPPALYAFVVQGTWKDPGAVPWFAEVVLMAAAVPGLFRRRVYAWRFMVASRFAVLAQTMWVLLLYSRLNGLRPTLATRP